MTEPDFVNVSIRIKPNVNVNYDEKLSCLKIISKQPPILVVVDRAQTYHFDNIFTEEIDQAIIYDQTVKPLVEYVKQGYNCTVFAYGQTGTGKTYTVGTDSHVKNDEQLGLIPRTLNQFFNHEVEDKTEMELSVSFIEIYNEKVFDLLQNHCNKQPLMVKGLKAEGFCQEKVFSANEAKHFLEMGNKNRHTAGTQQNTNSSRSHAIFTIYYKIVTKDYETTAKLNLVDLAGCESVKKTGNQGSTFHEGVNINKGLLCIGQVMTALSTNSTHIPYRQSVLTSVLQDSLNKKNFVSLIACVSPQTEDATETIQTLDFAYRVKKLKNKPEVNEVISHYKKMNPILSLSTRKGSTPFKIPNLYQTPKQTKKPKIFMPLVSINEPSVNNSSDISHNSKSFATCSSISSRSNSFVSQQTLSPVFKKYMNTMESALMNKIELVIKNTLKRPSVQSLTTNEDYKENRIKTPSAGLNEIQNEVLKLRKELALFTAQTTRATSSPIKENRHKIRKVLSYQSVLDDDDISVSVTRRDIEEKSFISDNFKVPEIPIETLKLKRTPSVSPIEIPRRSVRLSMKKIQMNSTLDQSNIYLESNYFNMKDVTVRLQSTLKDIQRLSSNKCDDGKRRRSIRIATRCNKDINYEENEKLKHGKKKVLKVVNTPIGNRLLEKKKKDSPNTEHTKYVLHVLNKGSLKDLQSLHTIGGKTAQQIILNRKFKGHLTKISGMMEMPGWSSKKFERFVEENFIKEELL